MSFVAQDSPTGRCIRVAIVEDNKAMRDRLVARVEKDKGLKLMSQFDCGKAAIEWLARHSVDVLLTDIGLPDISGIEVIKACAKRHPNAEIMVITMFGDKNNLFSALNAGANGYLVKNTEEIEIGQVIRELYRGGSPMSPVVARQMIQNITKKSNKPNHVVETSTLSTKEKDILQLISQGYTYKEISTRLTIQYGTVQSYIKSIYSKLSAHSGQEAVYIATQRGWF